MCVFTEKKLHLNIAWLCCHNFFIIGGILIGGGGSGPPGYAYGRYSIFRNFLEKQAVLMQLDHILHVFRAIWKS